MIQQRASGVAMITPATPNGKLKPIDKKTLIAATINGIYCPCVKSPNVERNVDIIFIYPSTKKRMTIAITTNSLNTYSLPNHNSTKGFNNTANAIAENPYNQKFKNSILLNNIYPDSLSSFAKKFPRLAETELVI